MAWYGMLWYMVFNALRLHVDSERLRTSRALRVQFNHLVKMNPSDTWALKMP